MEDHNYSARKKKTQTYCSVPQCNTNARTNVGLSFFSFPREDQQKKRHRTWMRLLRMSKPYNKNWKVCGKHFTDQDSIPATIARPWRLLKKYAIPSQNLPKIVRQFDENSSRAIRTAARAAKVGESVHDEPPFQMMFVAVDEKELSFDEGDVKQIDLSCIKVEFKETACQTDDPPSLADAACQVG